MTSVGISIIVPFLICLPLTTTSELQTRLTLQLKHYSVLKMVSTDISLNLIEVITEKVSKWPRSILICKLIP